jgi:DNA-binding transcriptional LysR family regulator|nr:MULTISPECIES: LysR family transcriptional regulator [unclassified Caballeronia]
MPFKIVAMLAGHTHSKARKSGIKRGNVVKVENEELRAFVAVAQTGSFQRAAELLHLTQPGLSRRIKRLEEALGTQLFSRTGRRTTLTGVGRQFLPMAREQIAQLDSMLASIREIAEKRVSKIRIASIPSLLSGVLPRALRKFASDLPQVGVQIFDGNHDYVLSQVRSGIAEFGVTSDCGDDEDLTFERLFREPIVVAVCEASDAVLGSTVSLSALKGERLIIGGRDSANRLALEMLMAREGISLRWFYEVEHIASVVALVRAGLGLAIVPAMSLEGSDSQGVRLVNISEPSMARDIGIVRRRSRALSPMSETFRSALVEEISTRRRR